MTGLLTFEDVRDRVSQALKGIFPELWPYHILDFSSLERYRGRNFVDVELPAITYSMQFEPHLERVVDYYKRVDEEQEIVEVEEGLPYRVWLYLACHSDVQKEAEELGLRVHRGLGRAPVIGDIPFYIDRSVYGGAVELNGIYSVLFAWEGWVRIAGLKVVGPLLKQINYEITTSWEPFPPPPPTPPIREIIVEFVEKEDP